MTKKAFLSELVSRASWAKEIHIILDNLSAHKDQSRRAVPGRAPQTALPLHSDLLVLAEPGRTLVCENPA
jgi:hypothetical protein